VGQRKGTRNARTNSPIANSSIREGDPVPATSVKDTHQRNDELKSHNALKEQDPVVWRVTSLLLTGIATRSGGEVPFLTAKLLKIDGLLPHGGRGDDLMERAHFFDELRILFEGERLRPV